MFGPANTPQQPVTVAYDCRGTRTTKTFTDAYEARRFYVSKYRAGKNPKVVPTTQPRDGGRDE